MTKAQARAEERAKAIEVLREIFPPHSTAKTILRHVSQAGMSRRISVISPDCEDVTFKIDRDGHVSRWPRGLQALVTSVQGGGGTQCTRH